MCDARVFLKENRLDLGDRFLGVTKDRPFGLSTPEQELEVTNMSTCLEHKLAYNLSARFPVCWQKVSYRLGNCMLR